MCQVSAAEIARYKRPERPKRVSVEQAKNGGYVVEHDSEEYPHPKHVFENHEQMASHLKKHFGAKK